MLVNYGNFAVFKGKLIRVTSYEEARARYASGIPDAATHPFKVIIGNDPQNPDVVVEVSSGRRTFTVHWLDELNRCVGWNFFVPEDKERGFTQEGRLFLEQTQWTTYQEGDTRRPPLDDPVSGGGFWFRHDGSYFATRQIDRGQPEEGRGVLPAAEAARVLWEPTPVFGQWDSLIRRDR